MKNKIKVKFINGGEIIKFLLEKCFSNEIEFEESESPDILFYSFYGNDHYRYNCKKILVSGENSSPNFNECDYAITCNDILFENRHLNIPYCVFRPEYWLLNNLTYDEKEYDALFNRQFCSAVISNNRNADPERYENLKFIHNIYKPIFSVGKAFNTLNGITIDDIKYNENYENKDILDIKKFLFQRGFKFSLAFENSVVNGYTTEKIVDSFISKTIPIYFGNHNVEKIFNKNSFINICNFNNKNDFLEYLKYIDNDKSEYIKILTAKKIINNVNYIKIIKDFLLNSFDGNMFCHSYGNIPTQR